MEIGCFPLSHSSLLPQQTDFGCPLASSYFIFCLCFLLIPHFIILLHGSCYGLRWGKTTWTPLLLCVLWCNSCWWLCWSFSSFHGGVLLHKYITESRYVRIEMFLGTDCWKYVSYLSIFCWSICYKEELHVHERSAGLIVWWLWLPTSSTKGPQLDLACSRKYS